MAMRFVPVVFVSAVAALAAGRRWPSNIAPSTATTLYDAPSVKGKPLFVIKRFTPVEPVVSLEGWTKVRDAEGGLAWIEKKHLRAAHGARYCLAGAGSSRGERRCAAGVRGAEGRRPRVRRAGGRRLGQVRHRDGMSGYVRAPGLGACKQA